MKYDRKQTNKHIKAYKYLSGKKKCHDVQWFLWAAGGISDPQPTTSEKSFNSVYLPSTRQALKYIKEN